MKILGRLQKAWVRLVFHLTHLTQKNSEVKRPKSHSDKQNYNSCEIEHKNFHKFTKSTYNYFNIFQSLGFRNFSENCFTRCFSLKIRSFFARLWNDSRTICFCVIPDVWNEVFSEALQRLLERFCEWYDVSRRWVVWMSEIGSNQIRACVIAIVLQNEVYYFVLECSQKLIYNVPSDFKHNLVYLYLGCQKSL